jgi:glycosyltransferase involved in cell wall biosynthesis
MNHVTSRARKVIFINSHPIQYFAPLYKYLNEHGLTTECWYCSDENVKGHKDRQFGTDVAWDIPLLDGYTYKFFRNRSWKPSLYDGFFGLINPGMIVALYREPRSVIVVHGWSYLTNIMVLIFGRLSGHTVCLRGENPLNQELLKSNSNRLIKKVLLSGFLFRFVHAFLFIGSQNKAFYKYYGVKDTRLVFVPYAVDNDRFGAAADKLLPRRSELREELHLPLDAKVILFVAKFISKKRPMDLLKAFELLDLRDKCLVMVGDGEQRSLLEHYIKEKGLPDVRLTGFVNQSEITKYFAVADVFVLCSGAGETWGLSVNEAMNFNLPIVVSEIAGCAADLVKDGMGGFIVKEGDVKELERKLKMALTNSTTPRSREVIDSFSYRKVADALHELNR